MISQEKFQKTQNSNFLIKNLSEREICRSVFLLLVYFFCLSFISSKTYLTKYGSA